MDIVIRNVDVIDGTGSPAYRADIGLQGADIAAIGEVPGEGALATIDGAGLSAAPGFIDMHSHSDYTLPINPRAASKVHQGVTTEVIGMCGGSVAPLDDALRDRMRHARPQIDWDAWTSFGQYLDYLRGQGIGVNVVPFVGNGTLRTLCVGLDDRPATGDEIAAMVRGLDRAMDEGAWGVSSGLIYPPSHYASTDELLTLCAAAAARDGFYFTHIRGEGETLLTAIEEAIEIGRRAGLPVQIAHLKAAGQAHWPLLDRTLALIDQARQEGIDVCADRYPYIASSTTLANQMPDWARDGGQEASLARLQDVQTREHILDAMQQERAHWRNIVLAQAPDTPDLVGLNVAQVADRRGVSPQEAVLGLLQENELRVWILHFSMSEDNLHTVLCHPAVMIGSDASALIPEGPLGEGKSHPRGYGTFPRVLGRYVREQEVLNLAQAVYKMSGLPARRLGLRDRGRLIEGLKADLVLFDPQAVCDMATFDDPYQYPQGIEYVFCNGQIVVSPEGHSGALPGDVLERPARR
jgi:N-acyl-D-amino-acid deacylase